MNCEARAANDRDEIDSMSNQRKKIKRLYLINRDFQLRYVKAAVVVGLSSTLLTTALLLWPLFQFKIIRFPNFLPWPFLGAMALGALVNFACVAGLGILMTHRIAGPMFALVRQMRVVQQGDFRAHLAVRQLDDLKYLIRNFNDMTAQLVNFTVQDIAKLDRIGRAIDLDLDQSATLPKNNFDANSMNQSEAQVLLNELRQELGKPH